MSVSCAIQAAYHQWRVRKRFLSQLGLSRWFNGPSRSLHELSVKNIKVCSFNGCNLDNKLETRRAIAASFRHRQWMEVSRQRVQLSSQLWSNVSAHPRQASWGGRLNAASDLWTTIHEADGGGAQRSILAIYWKQSWWKHERCVWSIPKRYHRQVL